MKRAKFFGASLLALTLILPSMASADDALAATHALVAQDREVHAEAFATVRALRAEAIAMDAQKRGRYAILGPMLEALGPDAKLAMVDELLRDEPFVNARPSVRRGWRAGLLHALGRAYDPSLRGVFAHVIENDADLEIVRVAALAMGKLLDDTSARTLIRFASIDSDRGRAVLAGLGTCRRESTATFLIGRLKTTDSSEDVALIVESLRDVGNSLAWTTSRVAASGESLATRNAAAGALVDAFLRHPEHDARITKALLIIDAPDTPAEIRKARRTLPKGASARLDALERRVATNPLHRKR